MEIEDIHRLDVKPGEVLLVSVPPGTPPDVCERIKATFETNLPVSVFVKTTNVHVEVVAGQATG
jgi:hypothetical protein